MIEKGKVEVTAKKSFLLSEQGFVRRGQTLILSGVRGKALEKRGLVTINQQRAIGPTETKPDGPDQVKPQSPEEEKEEIIIEEEEHSVLDFAIMDFVCGECEQRFSGRQELEAHDCERFYCHRCGKGFDTPQGRGSHQRFCSGG